MRLVNIAHQFSNLYRSGIAILVCVSTLFVDIYDQPSTAATEAATRKPSGTLVDRMVVAVYDASNEGSVEETRIHRYLELPLNHLGYKVTYWDISNGVPNISANSLSRVVSWFDGSLRRPDLYAQWLSEAIGNGTRVAIFGHTGVDEENLANFNTLLGQFGLRSTGTVDVTFRSNIQSIDYSMLDFEHTLPPILPSYPLIEILDRRVKSHLSIGRLAGSPVGASAVITTGPVGGYAPSGFVLFYEPTINRVQWILNPFTFFETVFGDGLRPVPDVTTISGRRLYFSHIDGDGWNNVTELAPYRDGGTLSSEVVLRELIGSYPDMPVSVGLIAGDVDPDLGAAKNSRNVASELFSLPHVEVASHTYSHPYDWEFFQDYNRGIELEMFSQVALETKVKPYQRLIRNIAVTFGLDYFGGDSERFISGSDALPRTFMKTPFDLSHEILGALEVANSIAPHGKRASLYQWSGNTNPFPAAVRMTREAGVRNINGGDSRFDAEFPSLAYVPPIARMVGSERQIYAVNSNENTYTHDWTGPFYAQRFLDETLKNTEVPRRLKGVNIYYHMYTGEKPASLRAVKHLIGAARKARLIPIKTSQYAALADSFFAIEIRKLGPLVWSVENRGSLHTVRFDEAEVFWVSMTDSVGVIGHNRHLGALYVTLDPAVPTAVIALVERSGNVPQEHAIPELIDSRWQFSSVVRSDCTLMAHATGFGEGEMRWRGMNRVEYRVTARSGDKILWQQRQSATADGVIDVKVRVDALTPVEILFECARKQ
jgi:hypothetical protein